MQEDFHYYATYCAAYLAGFSHEDSLTIAYSAQFVDCCSLTLIGKLKGPKAAATTQTQIELADHRTDLTGLQDITRIWCSFHFLPGRLPKNIRRRPRGWLNKYRLICDPNSDLLYDTVYLANNKSLQAYGLAMHILADTWAHRYFTGTPSFALNNATDFYEILPENGRLVEKKISFNHNPAAEDDPANGRYSNTLYQSSENSIMNLGHGRAGHLPDYSFIRYRFLPAWGNYNYIYKDNPSDYYHAFCQMTYALKFLRGERGSFRLKHYEKEELAAYKPGIMKILRKRQLSASRDWKMFGEKLSGMAIEDFDVAKYEQEYLAADKDHKADTFLGRFFLAALAQKSLVTYRIFKTGSLLAGFSIDFRRFGFKGIKDFERLVDIRIQKTEIVPEASDIELEPDEVVSSEL